MSTGTVPTCAPAELRDAARTLRAAGAALAAAADRVTGTRAGGHGWTGLAALEHAACRQALADLLGTVASPGPAAAVLLERCAAAAEDTAGVRHVWTRRVADDLAELARLGALGPPADPVLAWSWQARVGELHQEVEHGREVLRQAEEAFDRVRRRTAEELEQVWADVARVLAQARWVVDLGGHLGKVTRVRRVWLATDGLIATSRARRAITTARHQAALERARTRVEAVRRRGTVPGWLPGWARGPARVAGPLGAALVWVGAWEDLVTGGGHPRWRGTTTRVLAAAAIVGGPAALLTPVCPPVGLAGIAAVSVYQLWLAGSWAFDHRTQIPTRVLAAVRILDRASRPARAAVRHRGGAVLAGARVRATGVLRRLRDLISPGQRRTAPHRPGRPVAPATWELVAGAVDRSGRSGWSGPLRDWWRQLGPGQGPGPVAGMSR